MCEHCLPGPQGTSLRHVAEFRPDRRTLLAGMASLGAAMLATRAKSEIVVSDRTIVAPISLTRTILQSHVNPDGSEFRLILDIFPPGLVVPPHHHPVIGFNYVLEGQAESHYEGQDLISVGPGDTFQDLNTSRHVHFRNLSESKPLLVLLSYTLPKGQEFFIPDPAP